MSTHEKPSGSISVHPDALNDLVEFYKEYIMDGGDARWINHAVSIEANSYLQDKYPDIEYTTGTPQYDEHVFITHPEERWTEKIGYWSEDKWDAQALELAERDVEGDELQDELSAYLAGAVHACVNRVIDAANSTD